jgi:hypothetical protein
MRAVLVMHAARSVAVMPRLEIRFARGLPQDRWFTASCEKKRRRMRVLIYKRTQPIDPNADGVQFHR